MANSAVAGFFDWRHPCQMYSIVLLFVEIILSPITDRPQALYAPALLADYARAVPMTRGKRSGVLFHAHRTLDALALGFGDGVALVLSILVGGLLRWAVVGPLPMIPSWSWALPLAWWVMAYSAGLLPGWGLGVVEEVRRLFVQLCLVFGGAAIVLFLVKQSEATSRFTFTVAFLTSLGLVPLVRSSIKRILISRDLWGAPTVVYGGGNSAGRVVRAIQGEKGLGYRLVGMYDPNPEKWGDTIDGVPVLSPSDRQPRSASVAVLATPELSAEEIQAMVEGPLSRYRQVVIIPDLVDLPTLWVESRDIAGILGLEITCRLLDPIARFTKRSADLVVSICLVPVWVPLCVLVAAAIWLADRSNPLFTQERVGENGRSFHLRKFRTMVCDAEDVLRESLLEDPVLEAEWNENRKLREDPRVTRLGRVLRRWSLDELPQFVNVIKGEMSLVGPRPLPEYHVDQLPDRVRALRARVRPGITGLWQVSGRSDSGSDGLIRWDAFYVQNWSIWLDIVVLARTVRAVARGSGAY